MAISSLVILIYPLLINFGISSSYAIKLQALSKIYIPNAYLKVAYIACLLKNMTCPSSKAE